MVRTRRAESGPEISNTMTASVGVRNPKIYSTRQEPKRPLRYLRSYIPQSIQPLHSENTYFQGEIIEWAKNRYRKDNKDFYYNHSKEIFATALEVFEGYYQKKHDEL